MSSFRVRVHIAGPVGFGMQHCQRCGVVLIDAKGVMVQTGEEMHFWEPGAFIGIAERVDEGLLNPVSSFVMKQDASEDDEIPCKSSTRSLTGERETLKETRERKMKAAERTYDYDYPD
jgi:hypothetical protein